MRRANGYLGGLLAAAIFAAVPGLSAAADTTEGEQAALEQPARMLVKPPPGFIQACQSYSWVCEASPDGEATLTPAATLELARKINRRVNFSVTHVSDAENYGRADYWILPSWRGGDCEDFVLAKYKRLLEAGVRARDLSIAVVRTWRQENHAVLVLHHETGDLVLDSLTHAILPWNETSYRYLAMQTRDDQRAWEVVAHQPKDSMVLALR